MPNLTDHFSLEEMTFSETASRHGIDNKPDTASRQNLLELCENILEPIRELAGGPITVTSGYRSPILNSIIGGAPESQHKIGEAADINCPFLNPQALFQRIRQSDLAFDQLIDEFGTWVHISYRKPGRNRRQVLRARKVDGVTRYTELS
ncbi:MAG TPA: D-Ala-D-Ala carboxypeptidase family metallohydrolase [Candidatus Binatia bacterium]|nr:D-Ala-D-Ala carboxypeptidase family metallohydrolase [Candidatus Binatia bacterium]